MVCAATFDPVASYPCLPSVTYDVFQGVPCIKKCVQFTDYPSISNYETDGELWPYTALSRRFAQEFPVNYVPKFDERAISDATLVGATHEAILLQAASTSTRFEIYVEYAPAGQQWNGLNFMPLRIRAFTGHNDWITEASGFDNIPGEPITMDVNYMIEHAKKGVRPGFCKDFTDARRKAMPKIAYHTCSAQNFFDIIYMGIYMGDRQSSRGHAYLTVVPPWDRHGREAGGARADWPINIAVDVEMLVQLGCRLYAPGDGEALVTEDWITNKVIIYAYDAEYARFIWTNRTYVSLRRNYQESIKKFREDVKNGVNATPVLESFMAKIDKECKLYYKQWIPTACRDMTSPRRIKNITKIKNVFDENLPKDEQVALEFETARYVLYRNWARAVKQQPGETRGRSGLWQDLDPNQKKSANWRFAEVMHISDVECPRCKIMSPEGAINCYQCDNLNERMPDIKKIARVIRLQEMANSLGVPLSMDQIETQILAQSNARGDRSARGEKAVLRNKEYTTLYERLINDPFYAYTAARGDLTPSALEFIEKVARCIIPSFERTMEMIQGSVAVPKYSARLTLVPPNEDVQEIDRKDVYVVHGGRFLETEQFAALYGSLDRNDRYPALFC